MSESTSGGLIGAVRSTSRWVPSHDSLALKLVFFAGLITILQKAGVPVPEYGMQFAIALGIAALLYEMSASKGLMRAWYTAKPGALAASLAIWLCAFGYSVNQWVGAASENQAEKTNIHKAAFLKTGNAQDELKAAKADVKRIEDRLGWMVTAIDGQPVRTAAAAQAAIDDAMSHRFWKSTNACTETKGQQTRKHCTAYRNALIEKDLAIQKATLEEELKVSRGRVANASKVASETPVQISEARSDLVLLTQWGGLSESDAGTVNGLLAIMAISIFLSFGSMKMEWEALNARGPRTPFHFGLKFRRWWSQTMYGREPGDVKVVNNTTTITDRAFAGAVMRAHSSVYNGAAA
jgi:hypothetical protein